MRLFVLTRHAHSTLNVEGRINGDPGVPVPLTEQGRAEAAQLGHQLAQLPLELCVHTRFARTRETAECILAGRLGVACDADFRTRGSPARPSALQDSRAENALTLSVPMVEEPLLDDIDVGELEGETIAEYRAWKRAHTRADRFPGGESLDDVAHRYARAFRHLLSRSEASTLVVCHEIPIRYALNAAAGSDDLDGPEHAVPNATPYLFDESALERAANRIEELAG